MMAAELCGVRRSANKRAIGDFFVRDRATKDFRSGVGEFESLTMRLPSVVVSITLTKKILDEIRGVKSLTLDDRLEASILHTGIVCQLAEKEG